MRTLNAMFSSPEGFTAFQTYSVKRAGMLHNLPKNTKQGKTAATEIDTHLLLLVTHYRLLKKNKKTKTRTHTILGVFLYSPDGNSMNRTWKALFSMLSLVMCYGKHHHRCHHHYVKPRELNIF